MAIAQSIDKLEIITTNDLCLLGELEKTETGYIVKNAVEYDGDIRNSVKEWCKKSILDDFRPIKLEGSGVNISHADLSKTQKMDAKIILLKADFATEGALANLQAEAVDNIND